MARRRPTMRDVAELAHVSKSAVSLAFNDARQLSEPTLKRILEAAEEIGFTQDPAARMLRRRRTDSLGLLLPQQLDQVLENPYYSTFLQGVGQVCHREGMTLLLAPPLRGSMLKAIPYAAVDGFIVSGLEYDRGEVSALTRKGIPFVLVDSEWQDGTSSVDIDDGDGVAETVEHLLGLGHRRISVVSFETGTEGGYENWVGPVARRARGAQRALASAGVEFGDPGVSVIEVPCTRAGGAMAFERLWSADAKPTAIVAFSDVIAFGLLDAAAAAGVSVPGELSITGFDDLPEAAWRMPALTTVRQPIATKGRLAAEYLVEAIAGDPEARPHQQRLSTALLVRGSTAKAPR